MGSKQTDVLIVGAGISGMLCATELSASGKSVSVIDKGRTVGGRMATRQVENAQLDHGAQFFTVRDARLQAYVNGWMEAGVVREWFRHSPEDTNPDGYPRYCGVDGMTAVCRYLAKEIKVHSSQQAVELYRDLDAWVLRTQSGAQYSAKELVLTAPLPQSLLLLDTTGLDYAGDELAKLRAVRYQKGLAAMVLLSGPSGLPEPGGMKLQEAPLAWIADNHMKGISEHVSAVTIHADAEFSALHWRSPDSVRGRLMLDAARPYLRSPILQYRCHRWGFTSPINPLQQSCFRNDGLGLTLAGDAFGGPRVEGSALSGIEAAQSIFSRVVVESV
ncbi:MAG: NAD(P)/FAD-dependent oxidoreductase [Lentimonas sp.]